VRKPKEGCCIAGTEVLLCDGTTIPIESLQEGDEVWGFYHDTGQWVCAPVLATSVREVDVVVDLEVDPDGAGPLAAYTLTGTLEHPFFVPVRGEYVPMGELGAGDGLRREDGGEAVVVGVEVRAVRVEVFNLEVGGVHDYYVVHEEESPAAVLVHNKPRPSPYSTAMAGGKHAGFLKTHAKYTPGQRGRASRNLQKRIVEHEAKIADPASHYEGWTSIPPDRQAGILEYWAEEIETFAEQ